MILHVLWLKDYLKVNDPYVYKGTSVLKNKLNIKDNKKLKEAEDTFHYLNVMEICQNPFKIKTVFDVKKVHKRLFDKLYDWAGENRTINIYKNEPILHGLSVNYSDYREIDKDLEKIDNYFKSIEWSKLTKSKMIDEIVAVISSIWKIHCFREGNSRTVTMFLYLFMKQNRLKVNLNLIEKHAKYFRNALVLASIGEYSEFEHLRNILLDSISTKDAKTNKYKTIRNYQVDKYKYRNHEYKE